MSPASSNVTEGLTPYSPNQEEKTWAMVAHVSGVVSSFLLPLLVLLIKGKESPWVRTQAIEAINFYLTIFIGYVIGLALSILGIGLCLIFVLMPLNVVFAIIAAVRTSEGRSYRYPVNIRFLS